MSGTTNNAIHRAKTWQIAGFALNNVSTNLYMWMMTFIAYYLQGFIGVATVLATSYVTIMRVWDGITDPFAGYIIDKTNGKMGKNRPFILLGQIIMFSMSALMFFVSPKVPEGGRFVVFTIFYALYVIGYTLQCVITKSAQTCLTNDPVQRPVFSVFNGVFTAGVFAVMPWYSYTYLLQKHQYQMNADFFAEQWATCAIASAITAAIAFVSLIEKDREEYYGVGGQAAKVSFKDYWEILKNNRAMQMLVVSAGTDKLATQAKGDATVTLIVYAIICGNAAAGGLVTGYSTIPNLLFIFFGAGVIAAKLGQKKSMTVGSWGAIFSCVGLILLFVLGDPTTFSLPGDGVFSGWSLFTILFMGLTIAFNGFNQICSSVVITMTADVADYEVYRSGKYAPGMIGTLFSFVDKIISSFAASIIGVMCAMIGFVDKLPTAETPYSTSLFVVGMIGMYGLVLLGLIANVIAMKFYPLTKEKMAEIQDEIAAIKANAAQAK